jgi:hypothetical protein
MANSAGKGDGGASSDASVVVRVQFNDEWIVRFHVSPAMMLGYYLGGRNPIPIRHKGMDPAKKKKVKAQLVVGLIPTQELQYPTLSSLSRQQVQMQAALDATSIRDARGR